MRMSARFTRAIADRLQYLQTWQALLEHAASVHPLHVDIASVAVHSSAVRKTHRLQNMLASIAGKVPELTVSGLRASDSGATEDAVFALLARRTRDGESPELRRQLASHYAVASSAYLRQLRDAFNNMAGGGAALACRKLYNEAARVYARRAYCLAASNKAPEGDRSDAGGSAAELAAVHAVALPSPDADAHHRASYGDSSQAGAAFPACESTSRAESDYLRCMESLGQPMHRFTYTSVDDYEYGLDDDSDDDGVWPLAGRTMSRRAGALGNNRSSGALTASMVFFGSAASMVRSISSRVSGARRSTHRYSALSLQRPETGGLRSDADGSASFVVECGPGTSGVPPRNWEE